MTWIPIAPNIEKSMKSTPKASVGYGRIELNKSACSLLETRHHFQFAELLLDSESDRAGIRFSESPTEASISVKYRTDKGRQTGGITLSSKAHMEELFGEEGTRKQFTHYWVTVDAREPDTLILSLQN
jgi:hypothetical protein